MNKLSIGNGIFTKKFVESNPKTIEHFHYCFELIKKELNKLGYKITAGKIFDSGYQGFTFYINGVKCIVIEQRGNVYSEDHKEAYLEIMFNGNKKIMLKHKSKHFGDVQFDQNEIEYIEKNICNFIKRML
jgi:hypothetical protein